MLYVVLALARNVKLFRHKINHQNKKKKKIVGYYHPFPSPHDRRLYLTLYGFVSANWIQRSDRQIESVIRTDRLNPLNRIENNPENRIKFVLIRSAKNHSKRKLLIVLGARTVISTHRFALRTLPVLRIRRRTAVLGADCIRRFVFSRRFNPTRCVSFNISYPAARTVIIRISAEARKRINQISRDETRPPSDDGVARFHFFSRHFVIQTSYLAAVCLFRSTSKTRRSRVYPTYGY